MMKERIARHPRRYARKLSTWQRRAIACKSQDHWKCLHCGVHQFKVEVSVRGVPYFVYLHAAHIHEGDTRYPGRILITLCPACHARYDAQHRERVARVRIERLKHRKLLSRNRRVPRELRERLLTVELWTICSQYIVAASR